MEDKFGENKLPNIFLVEDNENIHKFINDALFGSANIIGAMTLMDAEKIYEQNKDKFSAICVDGCVQGNELNALPLIRMIKKEFNGPLIAISSYPEYRKLMVEAGCTYEIEKQLLPDLLRSILDL